MFCGRGRKGKKRQVSEFKFHCQIIFVLPILSATTFFSGSDMKTKSKIAVLLLLPLCANSFSLRTQHLGLTSSSVSLRSSTTLLQVSSQHGEESGELTAENYTISQQINFIEPGPNLIPPPEPDQAKLEKEFYSMMREFAQFTPKDIASIPGPRYRALYEGVAAGSNEPAVMNAFSIIFQDLMPVRIAGRMIYRKLKTNMEECTEERDRKEKELADDYGLDMPTINDGRRAYAVVMQDDTEGQMTMAALIDSGIVDTIVELLGFETFEEFVEAMDTDENEKLTFEKFIVGLQRCHDGNSCDVTCDLPEVLHEIIKRMEPLEAKKKEVPVNERKRKFSERYDEMVITFEDWEKGFPTAENDDGRMMEVLRGSFAGAKNNKIVSALKIVYMDYSALRVGGDLVFKLMSKLMSRRKRTQKDA